MNNEINSQPFINLLNFLLKKWPFFLIIALVGGGLGFLYANIQQPKYKSKLIFALDPGEGDKSADLASQLGFDMGGIKNAFTEDNILEILKSRHVVENTFLSVDTFNNKPYTLIQYYNENEQNIKSSINFPVGITYKNLSYSQKFILDSVYSIFVKSNLLTQRPDKTSWIFEINVTSTNEKFSKIFTERLINETDKFYIESSTKKTKQAVDIMESRLSAIKAELGSSIYEKAAIQDNNLNATFQKASAPALTQQANIQVYTGAYEEMLKNLEAARSKYLMQLPLIQIIDNPNYPLQKIQVGKLATALWFAYIAQFIFLLSLLVYKALRYIRHLYVH